MSKLSDILATLQDVESSITTAKDKLGEYKAKYEAKLSDMETKYGKVKFVNDFCKGVKGRFEGGKSKVLGALLSLEDLDTAMKTAIKDKKLDWNKVYEKLDKDTAKTLSAEVATLLNTYLEKGKFSAIAGDLDTALQKLADSGNTGAFDQVFKDLGLVDVDAWKKSNILEGINFEDIDTLEESIKTALYNWVQNNKSIGETGAPSGGNCQKVLLEVCSEKFSNYDAIAGFKKDTPDEFKDSIKINVAPLVFDKLEWSNPLAKHQEMINKKNEIRGKIDASYGLQAAINEFRDALNDYESKRKAAIDEDPRIVELKKLNIPFDPKKLIEEDGEIESIIGTFVLEQDKAIKDQQRQTVTGDTRYKAMEPHRNDLLDSSPSIDIDDFEGKLGIDFNVEEWFTKKYDPAKDAIKAIKEAYLQGQKEANGIDEKEDLGVSTNDFGQIVADFKAAVDAAVKEAVAAALEIAKSGMKAEVQASLNEALSGLNIPIDDVENILVEYPSYMNMDTKKVSELGDIVENIKVKVREEATAVKEEDAKINALIEEVRAICSKSGLRLQESYKKFTEAGYTEAAANTMKKEIEDLYAESARKEKRKKKK